MRHTARQTARHMTRCMMRCTVATLAIGTLAAVTLAAGSQPVAAGASIATECATVPYGWAGSASLAPGQSFATGVVVPSEVGVQLAVAAFDVSTVDPAPDAVAIWIGQGAVADGVPVAGGEIAVTNDSTSSVMLTRVELSLDRCYQVASEGPVAAAPIDASAVPAPVQAAAPSTVAPVLTAPTGIDLPATGSAPGSVLVLAALSTLLGAMLTVAARRRATALVHDR